RLPRAGGAHPRLRPQPRATPLDQAGRPRTAQVALQRRHGRLTQPDLATVLPTTPGPRPDPHPGPGRPGPQTRPRGLRPDQASNPVSTPACWLRGNIESPTWDPEIPRTVLRLSSRAQRGMTAGMVVDHTARNSRLEPLLQVCGGG